MPKHVQSVEAVEEEEQEVEIDLDMSFMKRPTSYERIKAIKNRYVQLRD